MQKAIEAWDTHFSRLEAIRTAAESATEDETIEVNLKEALSSINPDLDSWQDDTDWNVEDKVATTLQEQEKQALGTDVDWSEEQ